MTATLPLSERDVAKIVAVVKQLADMQNLQPPLMIGGYAKNVDLNVSNADTTIQINPVYSNYAVSQVAVRNFGTTASLTTVTAGLFASTGAASGIASTQALSPITTNSVNSAANMMYLAQVNSNRWMNYRTLYFRVSSAQGAAAAADVYVYIMPLP